ncbi:MAG: LamG domain-containing protein [Bdellovibrionaceae bacterium]|nr:LamG domain-containing protein [Pseudobdellovibrionaceae bacterium]
MARKNPSAGGEAGYNPPDYGPGLSNPYIGPESPYSESGNGVYNNEPGYVPGSVSSSSSSLFTNDDPNVISETEGKSAAKAEESSTGGGGNRAPQTADESGSGSSSKTTPEKSTFFSSTPTAILVAGVCGEIQVNVVDSSKNTSSTVKNESVAFTHATSGKFYSDSSCTKEITDYFDITSGTTKFSVYYKNTKAEAVSVVTSTLRNFIPKMTFEFTVIASDVNSIVLTAAETSLKTVTCVGPFTVNQYDLYSNLATANKPLSFTVSGYGSSNIYLDSACTQTSTGTFATDDSDTGFKFYLKNSLAESLTVNVDDVGAIIASDLAIKFGPSQITIALPTGPRSGDCSPVALSLKDGLNNVTAALFDSEFALAESSGWKFYAEGDSSCSTSEITKIAFAKGDTVKNIFFKPTGHGAAQVTATDSTSYFAVATATTSVGPRKLIWEHGALTSADYCFPMKVKAYDSEDNLAQALSVITVNLTDSSSSANFYSIEDTTCSGAPISSTTIPFGADNVQFRFRDSVAETVNITSTDAAAVLIAGTSSLVVGPNKLSIVGSNPIRSGDCNAYSVSPIDALNNPTVARQNYTLNLSDLTASGNFYASSDTSCSGSVISSISLLNGSSSTNFRYKDDRAETISLNVDETTATLTSASMPVVVGPRHLDLSGTAQILSGNCVSFTIKSKDILGNFANTAVAHTINLTDVTPEGSFYSDLACASAITSKAIAANVASTIIYYKNSKQQNATITTAAASGELTLASLALNIGPYKLTVAGNSQTRAGDCELFTLTTQDVLNNIGPVLASTSINLTDGAAGGNFYAAADTTCSASTISSVTIASGASTISYRYKNDTAESTTLVSSDGVGTGLQDVNQSLNVGPRKIALTVLSSMASGACTPVTVKTQDVNSSDKGVIRATTVNLNDGDAVGAFYSDSACTSVITSTALAIGATTSTVYYKNNKAEIITLSAAHLFAAGYDAFGNYVSDVSVAWSGTGVVSPWKQTTTVADDSVKVVGVKVGTGALRADYAGGGAGKTANVNFTVSSVNSTAYWQSSTNDILGNNLLSANQIQHAITWNVQADVSNSWRTSGSQSWRGEAFQNNSRSSRAEFPDRVFMVSTLSGFDIIDATNNTLWMRFNPGAGKVIDSSYGTVSSVSALNGKLVLGLKANNSVGSVVVIDFENDSVKRIDENGLYAFSGSIASRNLAGSWTLQDVSKKLSHSSVNNIKADRVGSYDLFVVGSEGGISVLQFSGSSVSVAKAATSGVANAVALDSTGKIYATEDGVGIHRFDLAVPASGTMSPARTYTNSNGVYLPGLSFNEINVATGTSAAQSGANSLYVGSAHGMIVINEHSTMGSVTSRVYTAAGSGSLAFAGSLYLNGSDSYGTIGDSGLSLGPIQGTSTTIEFWFSPSQTISSGNQTLLEKGTGAGSVRIAIESGILKFKYQDASSTVTTLSSSASSWTAGEWHHVAVQIHSSGIEMWVDGSDRKSAAIDLSTETLSSSGWTVGANSGAAQLFNRQIDELRVSNTVRYSGVSFVVPSSEFSSDAATVNLFHFNSRSGTLIPADDSMANMALNLVGGATWAIPKIAGSEHSVHRVVLKNFSGSVNCIIVSGATVGGITEFHNSQNSASLSVYRWLLLPNIVDIFYFHEDLSTDIDYGYRLRIWFIYGWADFD